MSARRGFRSLPSWEKAGSAFPPAQLTGETAMADAAAPHLRVRMSSSRMAWLASLALLPSAEWGLVLFGLPFFFGFRIRRSFRLFGHALGIFVCLGDALHVGRRAGFLRGGFRAMRGV